MHQILKVDPIWVQHAECFRRNVNLSEDIVSEDIVSENSQMFQKNSSERFECFRRSLPANIDGLSVLHMFSLPLNNTVEADIL
jgi:hypothetical protein